MQAARAGDDQGQLGAAIVAATIKRAVRATTTALMQAPTMASIHGAKASLPAPSEWATASGQPA